VPRRPKHPPLTVLTLLAYTVAAVAAVIGFFAGGTAETVTEWALVIGSISAVATAIAGVADLRAMRTRTRAANTVNVHVGFQLGAVVVLLAATAAAVVADQGDVPPQVLALTLIGWVLLITGATYGAVAANLYGAGFREETLKPVHAPRGPRGLGEEA
jgi:uncharacterized membrane protein